MEGATLYYFHPTYIHSLLDSRNEEELERLSHDSCDVGYPTRFQTILHWERRLNNVPEAAESGGEAQGRRFTRGRIFEAGGFNDQLRGAPPLARFKLRYRLDAMPSQTLSYCGRSCIGRGQGS